MIAVYVVVIVLALLVAGGAYLLQVHRPSGAKGLRGVLSRFLTWLRGQLERLLDRERDDRPRFAPPPPRRAPVRPAPGRPVPGPPPAGDAPAPIPGDLSPAEVPAVARPFLDWVAAFEPAEDTDIHERARKLTAFDLAYSAAVYESAERCIDDIGLDPASMQGFADYAEHHAESAQAAMGIHHRFARFFAEVKDWMASTGRKLPKDGDFLTPDV